MFSPELVLGKAARIDRAPVYFTTNGDDPRLVGGEINISAAALYDRPIEITGTTQVKARALVDGSWSALTQATFIVPEIVVSEINYNPHAPSAEERAAGFSDNDEFEFLELANISDSHVDLDGLELVQVAIDGDAQGIRFDFSKGAIPSVAPGERILVVKNLEAFSYRYGIGLPVAGQFAGSLSNGGETITVQAFGETVQQFAYSDSWYPTTDGRGFTIEILDVVGDRHFGACKLAGERARSVEVLLERRTNLPSQAILTTMASLTRRIWYRFFVQASTKTISMGTRHSKKETGTATAISRHRTLFTLFAPVPMLRRS